MSELPEETLNEDDIQCPWCLQANGGSWELEDEGTGFCEHCEKQFAWSRQTIIQYSCIPVVITTEAKDER